MACSLTKTGGSIGSKPFDINLETTKFIIANCNKTKSHFKYQKRAHETSLHLSISIHHFFSQISQCSFASKSNFVGSKNVFSIVFHSSVSQIAAVESNKFGIL
jgi:hypothetical protein